MRVSGGRVILVAMALALAACPAKRRATSEAGAAQRGGAKQGVIAVGAVEVHDRTPTAERIPGVDDAGLLQLVKRKLAGPRTVTLVQGEAARGAYRLNVDVGVAVQRPEEGGAPRRVVLVSARAEVPGGGVDGPPPLQATTVAPLHKSTADEVERALGAVVDDLLFQAEALAVAPAQLARLLSAEKDVSRLAVAVEIAATRRLRETVDPLVMLLKHKDARVSDRAIGALAAIGDRRAVKPLTRLADFRNTAHMAKVLDAIGALGGKEARDYLEFVSTGHDDADIRNLASEALERMDRGKKK